MLRLSNYTYSLESPCLHPLDCSAIRSWNIFGLSTEVLRLPWVDFVVASIQNMNHLFTNQYNSIKGATIEVILAAFNIDDYYPKPSSFTLNTLTGLGTIFSIAGGFIPYIGPGISAVGAILPAVGTFLGNSVNISGPTSNVGQNTFAPKVQEVYTQLTEAFDNANKTLFNGGSINGVNITDMMKNGTWVNNTALTPLPKIEEQMKLEILSRSIDALWKTPTSNKIWVQFTAMGSCKANRYSPQNSKYCANGGAYYVYNFMESGDLGGNLGYPWGGDKLQNLGLNLTWVTTASARSYQLAKKNQTDPFQFNQTLGTAVFLNEAVRDGGGGENLLGFAGQYPGSWTLPLCDTMTWGQDWNYDYVTHDAKSESTYMDILGHVQHDLSQHPPCMCGLGGTETAAFVNAAGLKDFYTYFERCRTALTSKKFSWPDGVDGVDFGFGDKINRP